MPSLFGALNTAVSGLTAQSAAFGNISDNVSNSQTAGFKRTDTSFADYLSTSNATTNDSGATVARPEYQNESQGTIAISSNPLALAINGDGFFQVAQQSGSGNAASLSSTPEYTRTGDFQLDQRGYLVNGSQQVLEGWVADPVTGVVNKTQQVPIQISKGPIAPKPTATINLSANLPATPAAGVPVSTQVSVFDAKGGLHTVALGFTQTSADDWTVAFNAPDAATPALGSAEIKFGSVVSGNTVPSGTIGSIGTLTGSATATSFAASTPATISFIADFGNGPQTVALQLGNYGGTTGLTQFAGTTYAPQGLSQDGAAPGNFTGVATQSNGNIVVSYDNGQSKIVAKVPVVQFADANALQRQNGQGFTTTIASGDAVVKDVANGGSATLVAGSVEGSNVDIAAEFTKLIVAQQAYAANSKVITTASDMLTQTIDMKR